MPLNLNLPVECLRICQAWKNNLGPLAGGRIKFERDAPTTVDSGGPRAPEMRVCKLDDRCLSIPRDIRDKWLVDPVRSPQWRDVLRKFDAVFAVSVPVNPEVAEAAVADEVKVEEFDWGKIFPEAVTTEEELGKLKIETSFQLSVPGAHMNITDKKELYVLATSDEVTLPDNVWIIGYGAGMWLQDEKAKNFLNAPTGVAWIQCKFTSDQDLIVFEEGSDTTRASDSEPHTLRTRFHTMEAAGNVDIRLGGHTIQRPAAVQQGQVADQCPATSDCLMLEHAKMEATALPQQQQPS